MHLPIDICLYARYAGVVAILIVIVLTPAYLARQTKKNKLEMLKVRMASWMFGWTGVGWLCALWWAVRK